MDRISEDLLQQLKKIIAVEKKLWVRMSWDLILTKWLTKSHLQSTSRFLWLLSDGFHPCSNLENTEKIMKKHCSKVNTFSQQAQGLIKTLL